MTLTPYPTYDANGNVSRYVDAYSTVVAHYEYGPFGNVVAATGTMAGSFAFRFSTKYLDSETALWYYGYRYYDAGGGRWLSRDPIGEAGGVNLRGFVLNDPVDLCEALGLMPRWLRKLGYRAAEVGAFAGEFVKGVVRLSDVELPDSARRKALPKGIDPNMGLPETPAQVAGTYLIGAAHSMQRSMEARLDTDTFMGKAGAWACRKSLSPMWFVGDLLHFGRDFGDGIYFNDGDWLDRAATAAPDFTRLGTMLNGTAAAAGALTGQGEEEGGGDDAPKRRTPAENRQARNQFKNNKQKARAAYTERTGQEWPVDENDNLWPAEHTPALKEGGDPMIVTPRDPNTDPHNIPGPDGLTDYQRWGAEGTPAREANRANRR